MNKRDHYISRLRGLEQEYSKHEEILGLNQEKGRSTKLTELKLEYIVRQYEMWEQRLETFEKENP